MKAMKKFFLVGLTTCIIGCLLSCGCSSFTTTDSSENESPTTSDSPVKPIKITGMSLYEHYPRHYKSHIDSIEYSSFSIDTLTMFYRCVSDTMLVGYALVPTGIDTLLQVIWVGDTSFVNFKKTVTIEDVQLAENALAKCVCNEEVENQFFHINKRYADYGRQYLFYYNKDGDLCVNVNCSCEKYDQLLSERYNVVLDGGDCYWNMNINLKKNRIISWYVNGEA